MNIIKKEIRSFGHALRGIRILIQSQRHGKIHLVATLVLVMLSFYFRISLMEAAVLSLAAGLVWAAEAINTGLEFLADRVSTEHHILTGKAKDVAAGGVLLASFFAACAGAFIFLPKIISL